jgi:hypothetical protein
VGRHVILPALERIREEKNLMRKLLCALCSALALLGCSMHDTGAEDQNVRTLEWTAHWIGDPHAAEAPQPNSWFCYRNCFNLQHGPQEATARIAVDSKYWLWINGKLVVFEGGLKRGPTPTDTYYDNVSIREFLREGENTIAILLWFFGKDGFSHKNSGMPGLLFQAEVDHHSVISDSTWRVVRHPAYADTKEPHPNYRLSESNVRFDARFDMPSWTAPGFNDSLWERPVEMGHPPVPPWSRLFERPVPLWKHSGMREYENRDELPVFSDGQRIVATLPCNIAVTPYLEIDAPEGSIVRIRTDNYGRNERSRNIRTEYVARAGVQQYEALTYMNGHEVYYDIPSGVRIVRLGYRESSYDTDFTGSFACDDSFYTVLWRKAQNTVKVNMRDGIQDPDRERAQWWGDAVNVLGQIFYCCDSSAHSLVRKAILNLVDWQRSDGALVSPVPSGSWDKELPCQMLAAVGTKGFWNYYLFTGDDETIKYAYPHVRDYLNLWSIGPDGLLVHRPGDWDWVDWGGNRDHSMIEHGWYCMALESAAKMARVCGKADDARELISRRAALVDSVKQKCWNGRDYRSPGYADKSDDRANGLAVVAGIADTSMWDSIGRLLDHHSFASPYMEKYVLEAFFLMGDADGGLHRMKKRYRAMVESDISTLWEHWYRAAGSYNHGWAGGPLVILSRCVLGVAPLTPGYETYQVMPQMGHLRTIDATVPTMKGAISVSLERDDSTFVLRLTSPPATTAVVGIPKYRDHPLEQISVRHRVIWHATDPGEEVDGIRFQGENASFVTFLVEPGEWEFKASASL